MKKNKMKKKEKMKKKRKEKGKKRRRNKGRREKTEKRKKKGRKRREKGKKNNLLQIVTPLQLTNANLFFSFTSQRLLLPSLGHGCPPSHTHEHIFARNNFKIGCNSTLNMEVLHVLTM